MHSIVNLAIEQGLHVHVVAESAVLVQLAQGHEPLLAPAAGPANVDHPVPDLPVMAEDVVRDQNIHVV